MMRKVLLLILVLICGYSYGQVYQQMSQYGVEFKRMDNDSVLRIPRGLGSLRSISGYDTAQIRYNVSDSSVYVHTGNGWIKVVRGADADSSVFATVHKLYTTIDSLGNLIIIENLSNTNLTQSDAIRTYDGDGGELEFVNISGFKIRSGMSDSIVIDNNSQSIIIGDAYNIGGGSQLLLSKDIDTARLSSNIIDLVGDNSNIQIKSETINLNTNNVNINTSFEINANSSIIKLNASDSVLITQTPPTLTTDYDVLVRDENTGQVGIATISGGADSTAYHTVSVINDSSFVLCDLHSNCDTIVIAGTDTSSLSNRINQRVKYTDTTSMLSAYQTAINTNTANIALKLNKTDTTGMRAQLIAGSNVTITGTYPTLTIASSGGSSGWGLTGNATTFPNTYLGTTGSATIRFITNNVQRMRIDSVGRTFIDSLYFGRGTGTNYNNVAIGDSTLLRNTTGFGNTVIGDSALRLNTSGFDNTAIGNKAGAAITTTGGNTIVGSNAGLTLTSTANTAVGNEALKAAAGNFNTAVGFYALRANTAANNVAIGVNALLANTSGTGNTAVGTDAGKTSTTSSNITSIGYQSNITATGAYNTSVGSASGASLTSGSNNTFIGTNAGLGISTGNYNTIIGMPASNLPTGRSNWAYIFDGLGNTAFTRDSLNRVGLGTINTPAALLHIAAGTTSIAPIRLTSGTNLTTPVAGSIEYDGTNLFFTRTGTTRESVITANAVNTVSPTSPNRTITVVIDGTTYYLSAKTTND